MMVTRWFLIPFKTPDEAFSGLSVTDSLILM